MAALRDRVTRRQLPESPDKTRVASANLFVVIKNQTTAVNVEGAFAVCGTVVSIEEVFVFGDFLPRRETPVDLLPASCEGSWLRRAVKVAGFGVECLARSGLPMAAAPTQMWQSLRDKPILIARPELSRACPIG